jgi:hypothetical protein
MIDTERFNPTAHVAAVAPAAGFSFTPEQQAEVAAALTLVVIIAGPALRLTVPELTEPAPVFCP